MVSNLHKFVIILFLIFFQHYDSQIRAQVVRDSDTTFITVILSKGGTVPEPVPSTWKERFSFPVNYIIDFTSDFDADGLLDYLEYYADTDPTDGSSRLKVADTKVDGNDLIVSWTSSDSDDPTPREYVIFRTGAEYLSDLVNASSIEELENNNNVTKLGPVPAAKNTGQVTKVTTYIDSGAATAIPLFYRVFLSQPLP